MKKYYLITFILFSFNVNSLSQQLLYDVSRLNYLFGDGEYTTDAITFDHLLITQVKKDTCDQYCSDYYKPKYSIGLFDLSDPTSQQEVGRIFEDKFIGENKYANSFTYIGDSPLRYSYYKFTFDNSEEKSLYLWSPNLVQKKDSLVFEFFHYSDSLKIYKIDNEGKLEFLRLHILQKSFDWITGYDVIENYLYITNQGPSGLVILDISSSQELKEMNHAISIKNLTGLIIGNKRAIIGEAHDKIHLLDIENPKEPQILSNINFQNNFIEGIYKSGYFILSAGRNFTILNDSSFATNTIQTQGYTYKMTCSNSTLVLCTNLGFETYDITTLFTPVRLVACGSNISSPVALIKRENIIFTCNGGDGVSILNVADSSNIKLVSNIDYDGFAKDFVLDSNYIYVADYLMGLVIIDISNLLSPTVVSKLFIPDGPSSITKQNEIIFLLCDDNKLYAIESSTTSNPEIIHEKLILNYGETYWGNYKKVTSANEVIWVQSTVSPLIAFEFNKDSGFTEKFSYESDIAFDPLDFSTYSNLLFYTHRNGIQIIDLNSYFVFNDMPFGSDHLEESPVCIAYNPKDNILYASMIVYGISGIKAYDITDFENPKRIQGYFPLGFPSKQMLYEDGLLYFLTPSGLGIASENKITSIYDNYDEEIVIDFHLSQNYPNPFNPVTTIKFTIPNVGRSATSPYSTTLIVYDILGSEIATLVNETKAPGTYDVEFDGSSLPSGIYFYDIKAGHYSSTKKMLLLK